MWRNYLTVGLRALAKNRTYAFINIFGLAIGLAACLMILLYVRHEQSYDSWLPNSGNVYQLQTHFTDPETGKVDDLQMSPFVAGVKMKDDFPQVERRVYLAAFSPVVVRDGEALPTRKRRPGRQPLLRHSPAPARSWRSAGRARRSGFGRAERNRSKEIFRRSHPSVRRSR
jgi:putative ABC transport system permease protein